MLWVGGFFVLKLFEGFGDIAQHSEVSVLGHVVLVKRDANVLAASPICAEGRI